ncbi:spore coat protein SA [Variibacter gotjawalensis]|uniref:Spore coat protein SA n=1 Tax=Variibacter gotjawalensis TaxID=1333996 RepID=A0A0S3PZX4_9BRAD|nr:glycosyltransferase [Variibacter gotjawalensis]NIK47335.1 glycosyltransferase involved in cell wall biosynthesis [Variibacter gotjawalensis]RZS49233.1 glycosyltransferase involved in cell wall biosynthesis [Variibacter gotjawalensis]BAT61495.1 spore coat protein SA [Variibacter gotjawalensis]
MRIVLLSGTPYLPQVRGGVEVNTHELAVELMQRGHAVTVLTRLSYRDGFGLKTQIKRWLGEDISDRSLGYEVIRVRDLAAVITDLPKPDVVVIHNGDPTRVAAAFAQRDVPVLVYMHGLGFDSWPCQSGPVGVLPVSGFLSISEFVADRFRAKHGIVTRAIPPVHRAERYRTERNGRYVTLINPVPVKGVDLALNVAERLPDIAFCFVKGWPLGLREGRLLKARIAKLPNVTFRENSDMKDVYRDTQILLVPSQWEAETWGRVVTEAHFSGIPVVASDRGGLRESVGPGGVVLPANDHPDRWASAIRSIWDDPERYRQLSTAALKYSRRPGISIEHQVTTFEEILRAVVCGQPVSHPASDVAVMRKVV